MVSFALVLPLMVLLIFTSYQLGLRTAAVPLVALNVQALMTSNFNSSYTSNAEEGITFNFDAVRANVLRMLHQGAELASANGYSYGIMASAYYYQCNLPIPNLSPSNPVTLYSDERENTEPIDLGTEISVLMSACNEHLANIPPTDCSSSADRLICYGVVLLLRIDVTNVIRIARVAVERPEPGCMHSDFDDPVIEITPGGSVTPSPSLGPSPSPIVSLIPVSPDPSPSAAASVAISPDPSPSAAASVAISPDPSPSAAASVAISPDPSPSPSPSPATCPPGTTYQTGGPNMGLCCYPPNPPNPDICLAVL